MPYASHFPTGFVTSRVSVCVSLCLMLYALPCSGAFHCFRFYAFPHMPYRYLSNFRTDTVLSHVLKERLWLQRQNREKQSPQSSVPVSAQFSRQTVRRKTCAVSEDKDQRPKFRRPERPKISSLSISLILPLPSSPESRQRATGHSH